MGKKSFKLRNRNCFYIFVIIDDLKEPEYYVVPSSIVARNTKKDYSDWLKTPGKNGQPRKDNGVVKFTLKKSMHKNYKDNWKILNK